MKKRSNREVLTIILGGLTLVLFSAKPYILDLIEPSKSIGQIIGENAKVIIDGLNGKNDTQGINSKRDSWSNIITILSFILLSLSIILGFLSILKSKSKWYGIATILLALIGLVIYMSQLAIGFIGFIAVGVLICLLYTSPSPRDQRGSRMPSSA